MAKLDSIRKAKRTKGKPFGEPANDETFEILIPEGAETGTIPDGDQYIGKLTTLTKSVSQGGKGNPQWVFGFAIVKGNYKGMDFQLYCPLIPNSLWKLADTLTALGIAFTPGQPLNFERKAIIGTLVRLSIKVAKGNAGYRDQSKIVAVLPHPDGAGKKAKDKGSFVPPVEEEEPVDETELEEELEDEEADEEEDEEEDGEETEEEEDESEDDDEYPLLKETKKSSRKVKAKAEPEDEDEDEDEDEEEVDVTPKRRAGPKVKEAPVAKKRGRPAGKTRR